MKSTDYPKTRAHVEFPIPGGQGFLSLTSDKRLSEREIREVVSEYFTHPNFHIDYFIWEDNG